MDEELNHEFDHLCYFESFKKFIEAVQNRPIRFWVYKKHFDEKRRSGNYIDECEYEDAVSSTGFIREVVKLSNEDYLLGFAGITETAEDIHDRSRHLTYYKLSEIRMIYYPIDKSRYEMLEEPEDGSDW